MWYRLLPLFRTHYRFLLAAPLALLAGWMPLVLYIPIDVLTGGGGNPIGLGLIGFFGTMVAIALLVVGTAELLLYAATRRR